MIKKIIISIGIILMIIGGYFFINYVMISNGFKHDEIANNLIYNKETWENGTYRQRGQMYNYLYDSIGIIDKSKNELLQILGKPDNESDLIDGEYHSKISYIIDKGDFFTYDMTIFFDSTNHANFILLDD
ncbi:MAG: hypothetical protein AB8G11_13655 [Saprospiraceae bacterium]